MTQLMRVVKIKDGMMETTALDNKGRVTTHLRVVPTKKEIVVSIPVFNNNTYTHIPTYEEVCNEGIQIPRF